MALPFSGRCLAAVVVTSRPRSVQYAMWEILPDPDYVADPARGSRHNRGSAVDVGLRDEPLTAVTGAD